MYLPYKAVTVEEDRIGNLQLWIGKDAPKPKNEEKIAYIQNSQDREAIYSYSFDLTEDDISEISRGYAVTIYLHEDLIVDIFS